MKKLTLIILGAWISMIMLVMTAKQPACACQPDTRPEVSQESLRTVKGQVLISKELPDVRLTFDNEFKYVGGQSFILYDVARAEQHFFVDVDKDRRIKRLYWIQFEGYLPSNNHTYKYESKSVAKIGPIDFIADAFARKIIANEGRPGSDGSRAQSFLESKGYKLEGSEVIVQRLVHLTDESKRNELMIIYAEDLRGTGLTAADLAPNGQAVARWDEIRKGLLERATKGFKISQ